MHCDVVQIGYDKYECLDIMYDYVDVEIDCFDEEKPLFVGTVAELKKKYNLETIYAIATKYEWVIEKDGIKKSNFDWFNNDDFAMIFNCHC